jgi:hypothetical protein
MRSEPGRRAEGRPPLALGQRLRGIAALLMGFALSACAGAGQFGNLGEETRGATVAIESVEGAPAPVVHRFVALLQDEAAARQITIVAPSEAAYRLRGYLASRDAAAAGSAASATWAFDLYGADRQRAVRLSGEQATAAPPAGQWDEDTLRRVARAGMDRLAAFLGKSRPSSPPAPAETAPASAIASALASPLSALDDWTPEASGIFRIFRGEPTRTAAVTAPAAALPPDMVPLPRRRPAAAGPAIAFAPQN